MTQLFRQIYPGRLNSTFAATAWQVTNLHLSKLPHLSFHSFRRVLSPSLSRARRLHTTSRLRSVNCTRSSHSARTSNDITTGPLGYLTRWIGIYFAPALPAYPQWSVSFLSNGSTSYCPFSPSNSNSTSPLLQSVPPAAARLPKTPPTFFDAHISIVWQFSQPYKPSWLRCLTPAPLTPTSDESCGCFWINISRSQSMPTPIYRNGTRASSAPNAF